MEAVSSQLDNYKQSFKSSTVARRSLTPHAARHLKRRLITAFCEDRLSEAAVARAFETFPELEGA